MNRVVRIAHDYFDSGGSLPGFIKDSSLSMNKYNTRIDLDEFSYWMKHSAISSKLFMSWVEPFGNGILTTMSPLYSGLLNYNDKDCGKDKNVRFGKDKDVGSKIEPLRTSAVSLAMKTEPKDKRRNDPTLQSSLRRRLMRFTNQVLR